jgi:hypothetical protein
VLVGISVVKTDNIVELDVVVSSGIKVDCSSVVDNCKDVEVVTERKWWYNAKLTKKIIIKKSFLLIVLVSISVVETDDIVELGVVVSSDIKVDCSSVVDNCEDVEVVTRKKTA